MIIKNFVHTKALCPSVYSNYTIGSYITSMAWHEYDIYEIGLLHRQFLFIITCPGICWVFLLSVLKM
jgi:hypothetical protein